MNDAEKIYHYTSAETLIKYILKDMRIKFSNYNSLNDPRESKTWPFAFYSKGAGKINFNNFPSNLFETFSNQIVNNTFVFCCSRDTPDANKNNLNYNYKLGFGHPRMWAQYGNNYKGVCIAFNKEKLHKAILRNIPNEKIYYGPIEYCDLANKNNGLAFEITYVEDVLDLGMDRFVNKLLTKYSKEYYFTKDIDWQNEWEYRWVCYSEKEKEILIPITDCIEEIIIGQDCTFENITKIQNLTSVEKIPLNILYHQGRTINLFPFPSKDLYALDGISFSTNILANGGVYAQAHDNKGNPIPVHIGIDGAVRILNKS